MSALVWAEVRTSLDADEFAVEAPLRAVEAARPARYLFGCGVRRRYGLSARKPFGKSSASSFGSWIEGTITHSSPSFQSAGGGALWLLVGCRGVMDPRGSAEVLAGVRGWGG